MKSIFHYFWLVFAFFHVYTGKTQSTNFNTYTTLQSTGDIPDDFSKATYDKLTEDLETDREGLNKTEERIFLTGINYSIDELLHSGYVIYGDPLSIYVDKIATKLLEKDPDLKSKLRFYTLKSTDVNAFSTDQGIIFVTSGLLAQINSEAHLAYILAHEIAHYTKKHVVETFDWKTSSGSRRTSNYSSYSKEKEFEADKIGIAYFHDAGYSVDELLNTFDVLMYSYLPFDEQQFPLDYWNKNNMFVPSFVFPEKNYPIVAIEDYKDENLTHPNIKKRKDAVTEELKNFTSWGTVNAYFPVEEFNTIRKMARFETVRMDVMEANYATAIYSIFMLEKEEPNSIFLMRMKAQAWLGLAQYKEAGKYSQTFIKTTKLEGESAAVHYVVGKLGKDGVYALALRNVYDIQKTNPNDKEINAIYTRLLEVLAVEDKFDLTKYSTSTYEQAKIAFYSKDKPVVVEAVADITTLLKTEEPKTTASKYDKIKQSKKTTTSRVGTNEKFDSTAYYLYGLSDIVANENFIKTFNDKRTSVKENWENAEKKRIAESKSRNKTITTTFSYFDYAYAVKRLEDENTDNSTFILAEPIAEIPSNRKNLDLIEADKLAEEFGVLMNETATELGFTTTSINRQLIAAEGTKLFNQRMVYLNGFNQSFTEKIVSFPVDYALIDSLSADFNTSRVIFSLVEYSKRGNNVGLIAACISAPPLIIVYLPIALLTRKKTTLTTLVFDIKNGYISNYESVECRAPHKKLILKAFVYNNLVGLKTPKK